jgi:hypothetical protein
LAALGPFFDVRAHDPGVTLGDGWRPLLSDLVDDDGPLADRVDDTRARLAVAAGRTVEEIELRVAASVVHLGLTARLLSPVLALAAVFDLDVPVDPATVLWQDLPGGAFPLSLPHSFLGVPAAARPNWDRWATTLVDGPLLLLSRAIAAWTPSAHVRQGNIASAVNGAVTVLAAASPQQLTPDRVEVTRRLGALLLDSPALRGTSTGEPGTPGFRRRNCCLIYRIADPTGPSSLRGICGDCVLGTSA